MNIKWSLLALSIAATTANAQTEFGTRSSVFESYEIGANEVYVNTTEVTDSDLEDIKRKLRQGDIVILDNTHAGTAESSKTLVSKVLGFGVKAPVVAAAMIEGQLNLKSISVYGDTEESYSDFYIDPNASDELIDSLEDAKSELSTKLQYSTMVSASDLRSLSPSTRSLANNESNTETERPPLELLKTTNREVILVEARQERLSCPTPGLAKVGFLGLGGYEYVDEENMEDPCIENNSRASLTYTVEKIRSEATDDGLNEDINFVRVSIAPDDGGGTGIFLSDQLVQNQFALSFFHPWMTEMKPFADNYRFSVYSDDPDVRLHGHIPAQENPTNQISETATVDVGISITASVGAEGNQSGGTGNAGLSATYSYNTSYSKTVSYETAEYTLENASGSESLDQAGWVYDRNYLEKRCNWLYATGPEQTACHRDKPAWDLNPAFDYRAFSAISHRNFVPGFVATFRSEADKTGTSTFHVDSSVGVMSLLATHSNWLGVLPVQTVAYKDEHVSAATFGAEFEVDWDRVRLLKCQNSDFTNEESIAAEIEANPECEDYYSNIL
ncbi:Hemolysin precursor [Grimontia celer]|uniref:Hemolysin n=1 Tax=Grimontia celer TaxID=1796497 RepID=A0A128EXE3_9GAMM|nr:leukocidin family pore-forming toxin [Grimontia celer]CZF78671.1 Hemolysin precursor [Grimontia celer]